VEAPIDGSVNNTKPQSNISSNLLICFQVSSSVGFHLSHFVTLSIIPLHDTCSNQTIYSKTNTKQSTPRPHFTPFCFFCAPKPIYTTPIINSCPTFFSLMFCGWLILHFGNIIFELHPFDLCPVFQKHNWGVKQHLG